MNAFRSAEELMDTYELMFGLAGRRCAEFVLKWASSLFAVPLDALNIRVVLAPIELGPYNRHAGYIQAAKVPSFSAIGISSSGEAAPVGPMAE